jgi:polysaccharide chain length determinant protein (PEP-CTERM system associated)
LSIELSPAHYLRVMVHRKWIVISVFLLVTIATVVIVDRLPNVYTSETVILVDPQKVPDAYVRATVTGDVRNRLGTLTQQVLSVTRLQKTIETFNLYPEERKKFAREDVIALMRSKINVSMVTGGTPGSLEAFRITYSGGDPRLVAQVTNQIAALFIDENLKAREQQATGTTDFLQEQLSETRRTLEAQEAQLRDFRMKHLGEMPEHQVANLTVLGQLQASLQQQNEALNRAEQQRVYIQSMMSQFAPVVDNDDDGDVTGPLSSPKQPSKAAAAPLATAPPADDKARLAALLAKYTDRHPEVQRLRAQIADREAKEGRPAPAPEPRRVESASAEPPAPEPRELPRKKPVTNSTNPVLVSQLKTVEQEIAKHKQEQERLNKSLASYRAKLEAIPLREQQIADLVRDYEINKAHYTQLLNKQLSAQTATQLEIRQKGEQFYVLDPAQPAQRPTSPRRKLIDFGGAVGGLVLGIVLAVLPEFLGASITSPEQVSTLNGNRILEIIPTVLTNAGAVQRKRKRILLAAASGVTATLVCGAAVIYRFGWLRN